MAEIIRKNPLFDPKVQEKVDKIIVAGIEREYTQEEQDEVMNLLFGDAFEEHDRAKAKKDEEG